MGNHNVIADVGLGLLSLLREKMTPNPVPQPELIGIAPPDEKGDLVLSLYLYNIRENGESRKTQMQNRGNGELQYPPMALDLYFLLTAHSTAEVKVRTLDEHRVLGRAMQVLYDNSVLRPPYLQGTLALSNEEVRIVMENIEPDILTSIWKFSDVSYKLSLGYRVGPVYLDSERVKVTSRVLEREIRMIDQELD